MKSKKATEYLRKHQMAGYCEGEIYLMDAEEAVEIAEAEMMEKAVGAHTLTCGFRVDNKCRLSDFHTECRLINNCTYKLGFTAKLNEQ